MRKLLKRWYVWLALFLPLVILAGYLLIPVNESRISRSNCAKIQLGWSEKEVFELLGRPTLRVEEGPSVTVIGPSGRLTNFTVFALWTEDDEDQIVVVLW
jgi:hypothetical protein